MLLGYDSVYCQRTQVKNIHYEGVAICYKRELFQLFKTVSVDFNDSWDFDTTKGGSFQERCKTDDVGLILFLQPWKTDYLTSALCVATAMLCDNIQNSDVRMLHTHYFTREIEKANSAFQVPVVLGLSLNDAPPSLSYNLLRTGRIPLSAAIPKKPSKPRGDPTCRASVLLKWFSPPMTAADPPINSYVIRWRPGGSRALGFESSVEAGVGDCVKYAYKTDAEGNRKIYAVPELQYTVSGLVSDIPYEFKVSAVNEVGEGFASEVSDPILMMNPLRAPKMPGLNALLSMSDVHELREHTDMMNNDWNVNNAFKTDPVNSVTQMTPRDIDGYVMHSIPRSRLLPQVVNPRAGWKEKLKGQKDPTITKELMKESVLQKSILRNRTGFRKASHNTFSYESQYDDDDDVEAGSTYVTPGRENQDAGFEDGEGSGGSGGGGGGEVKDFSNAVIRTEEEKELDKTIIFIESDGYADLEAMDSDQEVIAAKKPENVPKLESISDSSNNHAERDPFAIQLDDRETVVIDCKEALNRIGVANKRQAHDLLLRSAYESYSSGGEPLFTASQPKAMNKSGTECLDYIFHTNNAIRVERVLSLPLLSQLKGNIPQEPISALDLNSEAPFSICPSNMFDLPKFKASGSDQQSSSSVVITQQQQQQHAQPASRSKIADIKSTIKSILLKSQKSQDAHSTRIMALERNHVLQYGVGGKTAGTSAKPMKKVSNREDLKPVAVPEYVPSVDFGGSWCPFPRPNVQKQNFWLPNDCFASSHIALMVEFTIDDSSLSTIWK